MVLAARVVEIDKPNRIVGEPKAAPVEIAVKDVTVSYPLGNSAQKTVLSHVDLEIRAGEFVVVLGETGCGKSTLLRMVLGQEFPTSGAICVDGKTVTRIDARCGYVPQKYSLFPDRTMLGNVMYGPENVKAQKGRLGWLGRLTPGYRTYKKELRREAEDLLLRMGLRAADFHKYPHQLSGGMQQRVAIAQALIMRPPVLLMDEAFSALDPATRASLQQQLKEVWIERQPTVLFVTHNTAEALLLGTRLVVLGPYSAENEKSGKSNVLLDMPLPESDEPVARRKQSREFHELSEFVMRRAYGACAAQVKEELGGQGEAE
ncbi:MAG TPA: ABC transporter ATP-binding protein [Acidobacteriaceae bacterium]